MKRALAFWWWALVALGGLEAQSIADWQRVFAPAPVQASYLSRHPEILRWISKHPDATRELAAGTAEAGEAAKNRAINEWIRAWPQIALALADAPEQAAAWAEAPRGLADLMRGTR